MASRGNGLEDRVGTESGAKAQWVGPDPWIMVLASPSYSVVTTRGCYQSPHSPLQTRAPVGVLCSPVSSPGI